MNNDYKPLAIGLIGYSRECAFQALRAIAESNEEQVAFCFRDRLILKDGTLIKVIGNTDYLRNNTAYDQIFICDDKRWNVYVEAYELIHALQENCKRRSCVPEEFQILEYEV